MFQPSHLVLIERKKGVNNAGLKIALINSAVNFLSENQLCKKQDTNNEVFDQHGLGVKKEDAKEKKLSVNSITI